MGPKFVRGVPLGHIADSHPGKQQIPRFVLVAEFSVDLADVALPKLVLKRERKRDGLTATVWIRMVLPGASWHWWRTGVVCLRELEAHSVSWECNEEAGGKGMVNPSNHAMRQGTGDSLS